MGPGLLCGLACCAGLFLTMPAGAEDAPRALRDKADQATSQGTLRFREGVAAIIAQEPQGRSRAWSDIDRDRFINRFRLPDGRRAEEAPLPQTSSLIGKVRRDEVTRGMSFGFDGGGANLGPPADAVARSAEVVAYKLSEANTCNGLMPGVECRTIGGDDASVRLALALNF